MAFVNSSSNETTTVCVRVSALGRTGVGMAANGEVSSEEYVEDDSPEEEEEESEASFGSEEDEVKTVWTKSFCGEKYRVHL